MTDALVPVDIEALDLLPLDERVDAIGEDRPVAGGGNRRPPQCWSFAGARGFCSPKLGCGPLRVSGPREPLRTRSHKGTLWDPHGARPRARAQGPRAHRAAADVATAVTLDISSRRGRADRRRRAGVGGGLSFQCGGTRRCGELPPDVPVLTGPGRGRARPRLPTTPNSSWSSAPPPSPY